MYLNTEQRRIHVRLSHRSKGSPTAKIGRPRLDADGEDCAPPRQSMRAPYVAHGRHKAKLFSRTALRRYLTANLGKPWSRVYAEMCTMHSATSPEWLDVKSDIAYLVRTVTYLKEDQVYCCTRFDGDVPVDEDNCEFYVHPVSGTLMAYQPSLHTDWRAIQQARIAAVRRDVDATHQLHKFKGIWYEVTLAPMSPPVKATTWFAEAQHNHVHDCLLGYKNNRYDGYALEKQYGRRDVYGLSKKQLDHKTLQALGLSND